METTAQYPIGKFSKPSNVSDSQLNDYIQTLDRFPEDLNQLTQHLEEDVLNRPYREGGWTIRQLVHHISDSHHHAYNRLRWALSEDTPMIKAYDQDAFAAIGDYSETPIDWSIDHLKAVHRKMVYLFKNMNEDQWERSFGHPEMDEPMNLKQLAAMYAWHSRHHFAHIKNGLKA